MDTQISLSELSQLKACLSSAVAETRTQRTLTASRQFNVQPHLPGNCCWPLQ
ncbi:similar to alpha-fetoprotein, isoform CRA_b [Rattus norvegicus]|uniref:Similar to alpha-fetoprotein, isoform CRA_b n=1 Tax=Rattus norvegicus TaxID=10116 RepID=A6KKF0_RAT|nr:similar to alpha-fetoprotein, isoform CRA_b [Rattus norvegicus]